ncbi:glycoside hydrolase family 18 protein [Flavihumibacter fluvii]|uniref:glycoside hydrolase family 18 protein n=1 Tax=Flavihumibacter fluvii TaxID=2838157 RepID=UPI001BDE7390|nr:glycoside hydrolase family 18 protein [Flavihumibacter fluvii]ULQ52252.1 glycoside hydrolase family 18 protein [Flavihumibacter fluvii]
MKEKILVIVVLLWSANCSFAQNMSQKSVIAYYTGDENAIRNYPISSLSHIIYSFLKLDGDTLAFMRPEQRQTLRSLVALKKNYPNLKVQVSLGGWGGCEPCSGAFAKPAVREKFAVSVKKLLVEYGADGLDLDWEYPGIEGHPGHPWMKEDVANFTALVKSIRSAIGDRFELSFAAGGFTKFLEESIDWKEVTPLVNRINLMTYDLVNGYSKVTGHHTALHAVDQLPEATDRCIDRLLQMGVPSSKLVIGAAFYARVWKNVPDINHGLFQPGEFKTSVDYRDFDKEFSTGNGFVAYWDEAAQAPYSYSATKKEFATYDDKRSVAAKTRYVLDKQLGGIMFWELSEDFEKGGLLEEISKTLKNARK